MRQFRNTLVVMETENSKTYKQRTLEGEIRRISRNFKTLLLTGPRQVGKTTLLKHAAEPGRKYVSLDNPLDLHRAKTDPQAFLDIYAPPVIIDEIQYAPELFTYIKMLVDDSDERGRIWMTGSQQHNMLEGATESLAGRMIIVDMQGFSVYERQGKGGLQKPFLPSANPPQLLSRKNTLNTFKVIWQGSYPDVVNKDEKSRKDFYDSYVRTYLERDIRRVVNIGSETAFITFLKVTAARTGQELNIEDIARNVGVAPGTAKNWLSVLRASGLVYLLSPYFKNTIKRFTKRPKLYFMDTGLASYLAGWTTPEALETGAGAGPFFETFCVSEIVKSWQHNDAAPELYFFRDEKQHEIDLLIHKDGLFYPVEIKKHATPSPADIGAFTIFGKLEKLGFGCELCLVGKIQALDRDALAMSIWDI
jgi:predicted AAA+ superfamily ATPase